MIGCGEGFSTSQNDTSSTTTVPSPQAVPPSPQPVPPPSPQPTPTPIPNAPNVCSSAETQVIYELCELTNYERTSRGIPALTLEPLRSEVMQLHVEEMEEYRYLSHTNNQGQSPFDRLRAVQIFYKAAGENIAASQATPRNVVDAWMNSPGHRRNMLDPIFRRLGLGHKNNYWGQIFTD